MSFTAAQLMTKIGVEGMDKAKSDLTGMHGFVANMGDMFKNALGGSLNFAANLAGQGLGFLKDQLMDSIKVAADHQQVLSQTVQALKSTHDASGMTASAVSDLAESFSKVTPFSEDVTQSGENLLLTFTNIGKKIMPDATQAMLDMSQAMGQDMKSSAIQLGKAINDPLTGLSALQRVGVTFSDEEKKQIKTMMEHKDIMGAQKVMLNELATEFGGSATAAGKTFGGQMQILQNTLEDLKIKIGTALLPVLSQLTSWLSEHALPLLEQFGNFLTQHVGPAVKFVFGVIGDIVDAFKLAFMPIQQVHQALIPLTDTFDRATSFIHKTVQAVQPLTDTFDRAKGILKQTHQVAQPLLDTFDRAKDILKQTHAAAVPLLDTFDRATSTFKQTKMTIDPMREAIQHVADTITSIVVPVVHDFLDLLHSPQVATFVHQLQDLGNALFSGVGPAFSNVKSNIDAVFNFIKTVAVPALGNLIEAIAKTTQFLKDHASQVQTVAVIIGTLYVPAAIKAGVESAIAGAKIAIQFVANIVKVGVEGLVAVGKVTMFIAQIIASGVQATIAGAKIAASFVANMVKAGIEAVIAGAKIVASFVASLVTTAAQAIETGAVIAAKFVASLVMTAIEAASTAAVLIGALVPALISLAVDGLAGLLLSLPELIGGFLAWAAAAWTAAAGVIAATWPVLAIVAAIAVLIGILALLVVKWDVVSNFLATTWGAVTTFLHDKLGWLGDRLNEFFGWLGNGMNNAAHTVQKAAGDMGNNVSNSVQGMVSSVTGGFGNMKDIGIADTTQLSDSASRLFKQFTNNAIGDLQNLDSSTKQYMNDVADYIDKQSAHAASAANANFAKMHHIGGRMADDVVSGDGSLPGHARGILNSPIGHWAMVGERGPEPMFVPKGASIFPHGSAIASTFAQSVSSQQSSAPQATNTPILLQIDSQTIGRVIMPIIVNQVRNRVGVTF